MFPRVLSGRTTRGVQAEVRPEHCQTTSYGDIPTVVCRSRPHRARRLLTTWLGEDDGKERVARAIHEHSGRQAAPFLPINWAAIPENLLEAELLDTSEAPLPGAQAPKEGLLKAADGGTLLLDEVCELNPSLQAKLLRAVEEGAVRHLGGRKPSPLDVRFLASTNGDIYGEMRQGRFHEDLFFRPGPPGCQGVARTESSGGG